MEERLGAEVQTSWGMTELSPAATVNSLYGMGEKPAASTAQKPQVSNQLRTSR